MNKVRTDMNEEKYNVYYLRAKEDKFIYFEEEDKISILRISLFYKNLYFDKYKSEVVPSLSALEKKMILFLKTLNNQSLDERLVYLIHGAMLDIFEANYDKIIEIIEKYEDKRPSEDFFIDLQLYFLFTKNGEQYFRTGISRIPFSFLNCYEAYKLKKKLNAYIHNYSPLIKELYKEYYDENKNIKNHMDDSDSFDSSKGCYKVRNINDLEVVHKKLNEYKKRK